MASLNTNTVNNSTVNTNPVPLNPTVTASTQQLRYPIGFWNGFGGEGSSLPSHHISSILTIGPGPQTQSKGSKLGTYLVTGSITGELCHWEYLPEKMSSDDKKRKSLSGYMPRALLIRIGSGLITAIVNCNIFNNYMFATASVEGFLTLWSHGGGRCFRSSPLFPFPAKSLLFFSHDLFINNQNKETKNKNNNVFNFSKLNIPSFALNNTSSSGSPLAHTHYLSSRSNLNNNNENNNSSSNLNNFESICPLIIASSPLSNLIYIVMLPSVRVVRILKIISPPSSINFGWINNEPHLIALSLNGNINTWNMNNMIHDLSSSKQNFSNELLKHNHLVNMNVNMNNTNPTNTNSLTNNSNVNVSDSSGSNVHSLSGEGPGSNLIIDWSSRSLKLSFSMPSNPIIQNISTDNTFVMVLFHQHIIILSHPNFQALSPLMKVSDLVEGLNSNMIIVGGRLMSDNLSITIWDNFGRIFLFQINKSIRNLVKTASDSNKDIKPSEDPLISFVCELGLNTLNRDFGFLNSNGSDSSYSEAKTISCVFVENDNIFAGTTKGNLFHWQIPLIPDSLANDNLITKVTHPVLNICKFFNNCDCDHREDLSQEKFYCCRKSLLVPTHLSFLSKAFETSSLRKKNSAMSPTHHSQNDRSANSASSKSSLTDSHLPPFSFSAQPAVAYNAKNDLSMDTIKSPEFQNDNRKYPKYSADSDIHSFNNTVTNRSNKTLSSPICTISILLMDASKRVMLIAKGFENGLVILSPIMGRMAPTLEKKNSSSSNNHHTADSNPTIEKSHNDSEKSTKPSSDNLSIGHITLELTSHTQKITDMVAVRRTDVRSFVILITSSMDSTVCCWDVSDGALLRSLSFSSPVLSLINYTSKQVFLEAWSGSSVSFSPEAAQQNLNSEAASSTAVSNINRSSVNQRFVYLSCLDRSLRVMDVWSMKIISVFRGHDDIVDDVYVDEWCLRSDYIVTHTKKGSIYVWTLSSGHVDLYLDTHSGAVRFLHLHQLIQPAKSQLAALTRGIIQLQKVTISSNPSHSTDLSNYGHNIGGNNINCSLATNISNFLNTRLRMNSKGVDSANKHNHDVGVNQTALTMWLDSNNNFKHLFLDKAYAISIFEQLNKLSSQSHLSLNYSINSSISTNVPSTTHIVQLPSYLNLTMFIININALILDLQNRYKTLGMFRGREGVSSDVNSQSMMNALLSTLFDWENSPIINTLTDNLRLDGHVQGSSFAVASDNCNAFTVLFPRTCENLGRWRYDSELTARHSLAISTISMTLLTSADNNQPAYSKIVAFYNALLPKQLHGYMEPDISLLALFSLNVSEGIHRGARLLLQGLVERFSESKRKLIAEQWANFYSFPLPQQGVFAARKEFNRLGQEAFESQGQFLKSTLGPVSDQELMTAMVLCLIGVHEISLKNHGHSELASESSGLGSGQNLSEFEAKSQYVTHTLLRVLAWNRGGVDGDIVKCSLAADLLGKGLYLFKQHITEPIQLIRRLHQLSASNHPGLASSAHRALLESGLVSPNHFISCMGAEALNNRNSTLHRQGALMAIVALVRKHPFALAKVIPPTVQMIVRCLDPSEPSLRKTLLHSATAALHVLVQKYPMVAFHQNSQRFAVGTPTTSSSVILIYDLRTATKWRILEGHTGDVHAVSFSPRGNILVSYSANETPSASIRVWNTGSQGLFSGLLGIQGRCTNTIKLPRIVLQIPNQILSNINPNEPSNNKPNASPLLIRSISATPSPSTNNRPPFLRVRSQTHEKQETSMTELGSISELGGSSSLLDSDDFHGWLEKRGSINNLFRKRFFRLKNHVLYYYSDEKESNARGSIELEDSTCNLSSQSNFILELHCPSNKRTYILKGDNEATVKNWIIYLTKSVENIKSESKQAVIQAHNKNYFNLNINKDNSAHKGESPKKINLTKHASLPQPLSNPSLSDLNPDISLTPSPPVSSSSSSLDLQSQVTNPGSVSVFPMSHSSPQGLLYYESQRLLSNVAFSWTSSTSVTLNREDDTVVNIDV